MCTCGVAVVGVPHYEIPSVGVRTFIANNHHSDVIGFFDVGLCLQE